MIPNNHLNRTKMPTIGKHYKLELTEPQHIKLDNGIDAYIINESNQEFVRLDMIFNAGSALQTKALVASSTVSLLTDGVNKLSSAQIAQKIDYHGAYLDTSLTKDKAAVTLYTLVKHLPKLLPLFTDLVTTASFPQKEFENYIVRKRHQFLLNNDKVKHIASAQFNKIVFGKNSTYGRVAELNDYDNLQASDLVDFYKTYYTPQNSYIILSGKISDETTSLVNSYLGKINTVNTKNTIVETNIIDKFTPEKVFIKKEKSLQSALRIGRPIINNQHPDYYSLVVLNTVFGEYFGSRLMSNLREDKGYTYGIGSHIINYKHASYISIATEVNAQHTNLALKEIKIEMNRLCSKLISKSELEIVKNYIYGMYLRSFDGTMALAERYRSAKDLNLNFENYIIGLNKMMKQTPQQLLETANKYFIYDDMLELVVGEL